MSKFALVPYGVMIGFADSNSLADVTDQAPYVSATNLLSRHHRVARFVVDHAADGGRVRVAGRKGDTLSAGDCRGGLRQRHADISGKIWPCRSVQYLGAGVLLGVATLSARRRQVMHAVERHPGLLLACALSCAIAISTQVYLGHRLLLALPAPTFMGVFRVSGRFFWPVAYALLVGTIAILARASRRVAVPLLLSMAILKRLTALSWPGKTERRCPLSRLIRSTRCGSSIS